MKKLLMLVIVTVLVSSLLLAACPAPETPTAPTTPETPTAPTTPEPEPEPEPEGKLVATLENPLELDYSYHAPIPASMTQEIFIPWAKDLEEACGGKVKIIHHTAGSLLSAEDALDGMLEGICDIAEVCTEETPGRFPLMGIIQLPFLCSDTEVAGIATHELFEKYAFDTEYKDAKFMISTPLHPAQFHSNKEVRVLEDFEGMKLRCPGRIEAMVADAFGYTAVELTTGDIFSALDTGLVDATFFTYSGALAFGVIDVAQYLTECNAFMGVFNISMNKQVYERLPDDIKKIFDEFSSAECSRKYGANHKAAEQAYIKSTQMGRQRRGYGPEYILPTEERERWKAAALTVHDTWVEEMEAEGLPGRAMLDELFALDAKYMAEIQ